MIRTNTVELTTIPAVAYRQKLTSGGAGVVLVRKNIKQPGIASISKTSGEAIPADNVPAKHYPIEAFNEAIKLTACMPYSKRGSLSYVEKKLTPVKEDPKEAVQEDDIIVDSNDYQAIVALYTDYDGKLSYELLNKDLIKFSNSSSTTRQMIAEMESLAKIRKYIVVNKFRSITGNTGLSEKEALKIVDLLDEVWPKGVLRMLNDELKRKLAAAKKKR